MRLRHRTEGTVSWSTVSLAVTLAALLVLGVLHWLPAWARDDIGVVRTAPGLLTVPRATRGQITLGDGFTAALYPGGLRIAQDDSVMLDFAARGSVVTVLRGHATGRHETVTGTLSNLAIDSLEFGDGHAVWTGTASGPDGPAGDHVPVRIEARRSGRVVRVTVTAPGADGLVLHLDPRPATVGVAPALPERNLRKRAWWVSGPAPTLYTNVLRVAVGMDAGTAERAVDLRPDGVLDVHAWTDRVVLTVTALADFPMEDSSS